MALAKQTEFAFMKAAKGTDVPKPEVIELDEHVEAYKKKYGLSDEEVMEILRAFTPDKASLNNEGGLQDQGGSKDPVSGNDVPIGSLKEEVRDDVPAMLSEGEFVFPADVVRYYGLDTLMQMRQKAKQGLKVMEAMGQMGNSEEATIPDDIPFDMDDLELAEGGVVKAQQGIYVPPNINTPTTGQTSYGTAPTLFPMNQTATTMPVEPFPQPVLPPPAPIKTFDDLMGSAGYDELRTYVNDAGQQMQIPFKGGEPMSAIPEGYRPRKESDDAMGVPQVNYRKATDTTQSGSSRGTAPQTMEQQKTADDLLLGTEKDASKGITAAKTGIAPKSAEAFELQDFENYLKVKSPSGSKGVNYITGGEFELDPVPKMGRMSGKTTPSTFMGKAGDFMDAGVGRIPILGGIQRIGDRAIRTKAVDKLLNGEYKNDKEYNVLRNIIDLEPEKAGKLSLIRAEDGKELTDNIKKIKEDPLYGYSKEKADAFKKTEAAFKKNLEAERAKGGQFNNTEMTRMMITQDPTRDSAIMMGESNSEREVRERKEADQMRRAADMDAFAERENRRRAERSTQQQGHSTTGNTFSEPTMSGSGADTAGTHCCTASYKQKAMTISQVKELRRWHRKQSQIWQDGYDVWGKYVADGLVAKSKWQASVVKSVYELIIKKKLTLKGLYGIMVISSGVYPIGLFKRITRYGRIFQST